MRLCIFNLWEELEKTPETEFEKDLARRDSEASFVMSKNNLNAMKELKAKVECVLWLRSILTPSSTQALLLKLATSELQKISFRK